MLDALGKIAWLAAPIVLITIPLVSIWRRSAVPLERRFLAALCYAAALALALFVFGLAVVLRDGLGPDSVASHGLSALKRTAEGLTPLVVVVPLFLLGRWFGRKSTSAEQRSGNLW
jgi:hypothetical protein